MTDQPQAKVFRRRVFYIPGYDPFHPRRYRELYRTEGTAQAAISGYEITLRPKATKGSYGWQASSVIDGKAAEAEVEVLVWSDLVRSSMDQGIVATYLQLVRTAWVYISTGALFRLMRLRKGPMIAALYPVVFLLVQLALATVVVFSVWWAFLGGFSHVMRWIEGARFFQTGEVAAIWVGLGLGLLAGALALRWFRANDNKVFAYYLMHDYAYSAQALGANPPELEARMDEFRGRIATAMQGEFDEVLVVGHSSGAHLAVSVLADVIRGGVSGPALSFLSLGHVVPMVSFLPGAARLRGDLKYLAASDALTWVDVTAPGDGCSFALCDPVVVSGVAPESQRWPLILSAAFTQTLSPERWRALRWKFFRLHFQYLCAFDRPGDYDYFRITGGAVSLGARFAGRSNSRSTIAAPQSRYRSVSS